MLIEILSFFAIAAALATLVCLLRGAPAWFWPVGVPGALLVLAASGLGTALISGDPLAGRALGVAGLVIWVAAWVTLRRWQPMAVLMFAMLVMAALSYIVYASALTVVQSSGAVFLLASSLLLVLETVGLFLSLSYAFEILDVMGRRGSPAPPPPVGPPPMVALQVPTYSEPVEIVRSTLEALARLEYPNYMVQVVDNNTPDPSLWRPLQQLCEQLGPRFEFIRLENWPGFKAGALNEATRRLPREVEVVGVVDADYVVHPGWLAGTAPHFGDPHVAFVQAAQHYRDWEDDPYLRGLFYSYRYFFDVSMPTRAHRNAIIFCGTMGLIRRSVLEEVGGWDPECITEDAECSLRILALRSDLVGVYDPRPWGAGMMPLSFDGLKKQRFRWALGGIQILRKHWRDLVPLLHHRLRLTFAQRMHYLLGSVQWFGDLLTSFFTLILVVTAVAVASHHTLPLRQMVGTVLVVPVLFLLTGLLRAMWALRRMTGCGWGDALRALRVWFALSWVVSLACIRGLIRRGAAFLRTPKVKEGSGTMWRALRQSFAETFIALVAVLAVGAMILRAPGVSTSLLGLLLLFEAFVYGSARWASAAAEKVAMTPARRMFLRSAQNTGERPSRAPVLTALGAGGVAAALAAALV
ncbi:MAG: glycosyltransferase, partial [Candidatus Dormiibacterota bacterium]